jgi:hypothetical protein
LLEGREETDIKCSKEIQARNFKSRLGDVESYASETRFRNQGFQSVPINAHINQSGSHRTPGLPDFSWCNIPKRENIYKMVI